MENYENIWTINPSSSTAYGALLMLLIASVIYLSKQVQSKDEKIHELTNKLHLALDIVTDKLNDVKNTHRDIKSLSEKILYIIENKK